MSQVNELIKHIKIKLRASGMTYKDLAAKINVSESTLKRWFSQNSFNIERLDQICMAMAIDLADVLPKRRERLMQHTLLESQELELAADEGLLITCYLAISGWTAAEMVRRYDVTLIKLRTYLIRLDQLGLIELHPGDRIVSLVSQNMRWSVDGPLHHKYGQQIRQDFMESQFDGENEHHWLVSGGVSPASLQVFHRKLDVLLKEFRDLIDLDQGLAKEECVNITFFAAHRPWVFPILKLMRR